MSSVTADPIGLTISDTATIRNVTALHKQFTDALALRRDIVVTLVDDPDIDLSFIQLIESARRHAAAQGVGFRLGAAASGTLLETLERAGFLDDPAQPAVAFWLNKEIMQ